MLPILLMISLGTIFVLSISFSSPLIDINSSRLQTKQLSQFNRWAN